MRPEFGYSVTPGPPQGVAEESAAAEALGYDRIGIWDSPALFREPWVTLTATALTTERAAIGLWVTNPLSRHPAATAASAASVDDLAPGRTYIGIGSGGTGAWHLGYHTASLGVTPRSSAAAWSSSPRARGKPAARRRTSRCGSPASGFPASRPGTRPPSRSTSPAPASRESSSPPSTATRLCNSGRRTTWSPTALSRTPKEQYADLAESLGIADYLRSRFVFHGAPEEVEAQIRAAMKAGASRFDGAIDADLPEHYERIERWARDVIPRFA